MTGNKLLSPLLRILCIVSLICFTGCGKDDEQLRDDAIEKANYWLTSWECDKALAALNEVGNHPYHARYLQTLASAYACKAGFSELTFWGTDLAKIGTSATAVLGSLTTFTTSLMTFHNDNSYGDLLKAIDTLLYAGNIQLNDEPSSGARLGKFTTAEVGDMNFQLIMMILAQMGKFGFYYGNANPVDGTKGNGAVANGNPNGNPNSCFYTYTDAGVIVYLGTGFTGGCTDVTNAATGGHPELAGGGVGTADRVSRMCQGLVLFNNFFDVLVNTTVSSNSGSLQGLDTTLTTFYSAACTVINLGNICTIKSQTRCESLYAGDLVSLQKYYAYVYETMFQ
ncbi:MAG: hypothetical protein HOE90_08450 [Bacteriovoracaceae bacterium]|nr:hypothetical protein [Bacteriovoracaceae bacterium]